MSPLTEISTTDLLRLRECVRRHFGQLYVKDELVSGENDEDNERYMRMYGMIMRHYAEKPDTDGMEQETPNSQDIAIFRIDREIEKRETDGIQDN